MPDIPATANMLKTALPTIAPTPMSPLVINVPTRLTNSSGDEVPTAIIEAPATSRGKWRPGKL